MDACWSFRFDTDYSEMMSAQATLVRKANSMQYVCRVTPHQHSNNGRDAIFEDDLIRKGHYRRDSRPRRAHYWFDT